MPDTNPYFAQYVINFQNSKGSGFVTMYLEGKPIFGLTDLYKADISTLDNEQLLFHALDWLGPDADPPFLMDYYDYLESYITFSDKASLFFLAENYILYTITDRKAFELEIWGSLYRDYDHSILLGTVIRHDPHGDITITSLGDYDITIAPRGNDNFGVSFQVSSQAQLLLTLTPKSGDAVPLSNVYMIYKLLDITQVYTESSHFGILQKMVFVITDVYKSTLNTSSKFALADTVRILDNSAFDNDSYNEGALINSINQSSLPPGNIYLSGANDANGTIILFFRMHPVIPGDLSLHDLNVSLSNFDPQVFPGMDPITMQSKQNLFGFSMMGFYSRLSDIVNQTYMYGNNDIMQHTDIMFFAKLGDTWTKLWDGINGLDNPPHDVVYDDDTPIPRSSLATIAMTMRPRNSNYLSLWFNFNNYTDMIGDPLLYINPSLPG